MFHPAMKMTAALALSAALIACKSSGGVDQAEDASNAMTDMMEAMADAPQKITGVSASLAQLSKEGGDMKAEFAAFTKNVDDMLEHQERLRSLNEKVEENKGTFTAAWDERLQAIQGEDLRARAEERRAAVQAEFGEVKAVVDSAREEFDPWMKKVVDVQTYLESDLNPTGVSSIQDVIDEVSAGAASVNEKIKIVLEELDRMGQAISAAKPPVESDGEGETP